MSQQSKLVGKTKIVIDSPSFAQVPRSSSDLSKYDPEYSREVVGVLNLGDIQTDNLKKDLLRVALGKYWDLGRKNPAYDDEDFDKDWTPLRVFYDTPIQIEHCFSEAKYINVAKKVSVEKISLYCNLPANANLGAGTPGENGHRAWCCAIKTGIQDLDGTIFPPIIDATRDFYDHYHEVNRPFTPKEMLEKVFDGHGKIYVANYKTYYNERLRSGDYETAIGTQGWVNNALPSIYGFLRIIAGPQNLGEANIDRYDQIVEEIKPYYSTVKNYDNITKRGRILYEHPFESLVSLYGSIGTENYDIPKTTKEEKNSKIIHRLVNAPYDSSTVFNPYKPRRGASMIDLDGLFESYFDEYTYRITQDPKMNKKIIYNKNIQMLEKVMSNIFFDASVIPIMNKIDKYKNYFPFYNEIEFSTERDTTIGDFAKDHNLIDILAYHFASSASRDRAQTKLPFHLFTKKEPEQEYSTEKYDLAKPFSFVDLNEDPVTQTLEEGSKVETIARYPVQTTKMTIDIVKMLTDFLETDDYFDDFASNTYDIRNFSAHLKSDLNEESWMVRVANMIAGDLDNVFNKKINGPTLKEKILEIYDKVKRDYKDIIEGVPAHSEDIFYRIEKVIIRNDGDEYTIQNMFFPNTSELDLIKYVDTQIKYHTHAKYKYKIYAYRVVFGSKYRYQWTAPFDEAKELGSGILDKDDPHGGDLKTIFQEAVSITAGYALPRTEQGPYPPLQFSDDEDFRLLNGVPKFNDSHDYAARGLGVSNQQGTTLDYFYRNHTADLRVKISPSIKVVVDKIFETPVMMIMDKPPVPPHVDIIPYRAVNNKLKIMLDGLVDRYRQEPIQMLETDTEEIQKALNAQLSPDGKIEFGSDDPVFTFQIFRADKHPEKYTDFEWYQTVNGNVFEETILPNKKYWYTFRSIDTHGHISNPSSIYEAELVDMKGAVRPIIRAVPLFKPEISDNVLEVQKYLYLTPTLTQLHFSDNPETDSIFSSKDVKKKYKIRLTSKSSGKKMDINLSFEKRDQVSKTTKSKKRKNRPRRERDRHHAARRKKKK